MAVVGTAVEKRGSPGPLRESATGISITRTFIVKTDSAADDAIIVDRAVGLPQRGNFYSTSVSSHPYIFCYDRSIRRISDHSRIWLVECEYRTPDPNNRDEQKNDQTAPEFELPVIRGSSTSELRDIMYDKNDAAIKNSANDPFKPHPKIEVFFPTLFIQRNEPITSPVGATQLAYVGRVSSDTFWGLAAGKWRCVSIEWELASKTLATGRLLKWLVVSYQFHAKDNWKLKLLDYGPNILVSGNKRKYKTEDGYETDTLLNGSGAATGTPNYLEFDIYQTAAFQSLQLPQSPINALPQ